MIALGLRLDEGEGDSLDVPGWERGWDDDLDLTHLQGALANPLQVCKVQRGCLAADSPVEAFRQFFTAEQMRTSVSTSRAR
jgi:hypothetical protein